MKAKKYRIVDTLPTNAMSVADYAKNKGVTVAAIYMNFLRLKADYDIVNFKGYNFIIW